MWQRQPVVLAWIHWGLAVAFLSPVLVIGFAILQVRMAAETGRAAALEDVTKGHFVIRTYRLTLPWTLPEVTLQTRYGVRYHAVAGCIVSEVVRAEADAYNSVSLAAIKARFGDDILRPPPRRDTQSR